MIRSIARYLCNSLLSGTLQNPTVSSIEPSQGPVDGGTLVTLLGHVLNTGAEHSVQFAGHRCNVSRYAAK